MRRNGGGRPRSCGRRPRDMRRSPSALLEAGADFRSPLASGYTPLFFAVREGRTNVARILLEAGADVNEAMQRKKSSSRSPARGTTPLILAVENGHFELAVALLEAGADPNDQRSGFTALHTLTWVRKANRGDDESGDPVPIGSGNLSSLQLVDKLVDHGADVNARLKRGRSGRGVLSRNGATPFLLAAVTADVPFMKMLIKLGADPRLPNAQHCTPLMAAAGVGCLATEEEAGTEDEAIEAVKLALELGNDVNAVDDNGETADARRGLQELSRGSRSSSSTRGPRSKSGTARTSMGGRHCRSPKATGPATSSLPRRPSTPFAK